MAYFHALHDGHDMRLQICDAAHSDSGQHPLAPHKMLPASLAWPISSTSFCSSAVSPAIDLFITTSSGKGILGSFFVDRYGFVYVWNSEKASSKNAGWDILTFFTPFSTNISLFTPSMKSLGTTLHVQTLFMTLYSFSSTSSSGPTASMSSVYMDR